MLKMNKDIIPAMLAPGEVVLNNEASDLVGRQNMANLNKLGLAVRAQRYSNGTTSGNGVQLGLPRLGRKLDTGNGVEGNTPIPGVVRQGNSYSQATNFAPTVRPPTAEAAPPTYQTGYIAPQHYADGTDEQGAYFRPSQPPTPFETIKGMLGLNPKYPELPPQPPSAPYYPTLEESKQRYEFSQGIVPPMAKGYVNGVAGVQPDPYYNPERELQVKRAMEAVPFVRNPIVKPKLLDEASRSVGNVLGDYADRFASSAPTAQAADKPPPVTSAPPKLGKAGTSIAGAQRQGNGYSAAPAADHPPTPTYTKSDVGLPSFTSNDTVTFHNADGSGQGSVSGYGLGNKINDGHGSFSTMKLESPYGAGGNPNAQQNQAYQPQQVNYQPSASPDYSQMIQEHLDRLSRSSPTSGFGDMLADKHQKANAQAALHALTGLQENAQNAAVNRDKIGTDQAQFNQNLGFQAFNQNQDNQLQQQQFDYNSQINNAKAQKEASKTQQEQAKYLFDTYKPVSKLVKQTNADGKTSEVMKSYYPGSTEEIKHAPDEAINAVRANPHLINSFISKYKYHPGLF